MLGSGLVIPDDGDRLAENMGDRKLLSWEVVVSFPHLGLSLRTKDRHIWHDQVGSLNILLSLGVRVSSPS